MFGCARRGTRRRHCSVWKKRRQQRHGSPVTRCSGLATSASANDAPGQAIQRQLRHKKFAMKYIRSGQLYKKNAAGMAGL